MRNKKFLGLVLIFTLFIGCSASDSERLDRITFEGQECVGVRDGLGRLRNVDCEWPRK